MRTSITPVALNDRRHVEVGQHVSDGASVAHWLRCKGHPCRICRLMRNVARECGQPSIRARGRGVMHLRGVCGRAASPWPRSTKSRGYLVRGTEKLRCAAAGRSACASERRQRADQRPVSPTRGPGSTAPSSSASPSPSLRPPVRRVAGCSDRCPGAAAMQRPRPCNARPRVRATCISRLRPDPGAPSAARRTWCSSWHDRTGGRTGDPHQRKLKRIAHRRGRKPARAARRRGARELISQFYR